MEKSGSQKRRLIFKRLVNRIGRTRIVSESASGEKDEKLQINLLGLIRLLLLNKKLIAAFCLLVMVTAGVVAFVLPNKYQSTASILPTGQGDDLSVLKQLTGISTAAYNPEENSSLLFPVIIRSNLIKDAVLRRMYTIHENSQEEHLTLNDYFGDERPEILRARLDRITAIEVDKKTGVIKLAVETRYPELSQAVLTEVLEELEAFNLYRRHSSAREQVRYLERELADKGRELAAAEDSLEAYQSYNRNWTSTSDPEILKILRRLQRDVEIKSRTYTLLCEQYEIARLDERKDIPIVSVLDAPSLPTMKSSPQRLKLIIISGMAAFFIAAFFIVAVDAWRKREISNGLEIDNRKRRQGKPVIREGAEPWAARNHV